MDQDRFLKLAKERALMDYNAQAAVAEHEITLDDVYIVWFCKTLQNWKALVSTTVDDDTSYFEVTYDGDKKRSYCDWYLKKQNTCISHENPFTNF